MGWGSRTNILRETLGCQSLGLALPPCPQGSVPGWLPALHPTDAQTAGELAVSRELLGPNSAPSCAFHGQLRVFSFCHKLTLSSWQDPQPQGQNHVLSSVPITCARTQEMLSKFSLFLKIIYWLCWASVAAGLSPVVTGWGYSWLCADSL